MTSKPLASPTLDTPPTLHELALIARAFAPQLLDGGLYDLLAYLNGLTSHRFTGIYRFEPGWVVSVALFDRENPSMRSGADVKMKESYCWLTGLGGSGYAIEDASTDPRLAGHAARESVRSYIAVLLRDKRGAPWGTLCHFDFQPQAATPEARERLEVFRPLIEEMVVRDERARWDPDVPPDQRCRHVEASDQQRMPAPASSATSSRRTREGSVHPTAPASTPRPRSP